MRFVMNFNTPEPTPAEVVFFNGKIATQDDKRSFADALAVANARIIASGSGDAVMHHENHNTWQVDLKGRTIIPGLNDSHLYIIRGGLNFNMESLYATARVGHPERRLRRGRTRIRLVAV
jgi:predicted amidohydrolase YtcJ